MSTTSSVTVSSFRRPLRHRFRLGRALGLTLALSATALAVAGPASAEPIELDPDPWPEACSRDQPTDPVDTSFVPTVGTILTVFHTDAGLASKQVVVIFNGNSYGPGEYDPLAQHLVQQGYITAVAWRPELGIGGDAQYVLDAVGEVLAAVGIGEDDPELRIGLVGHSQGGRLTVEAAALNLGAGDPLPILALVGLSPAAEDHTILNQFDMPAYFSIYGTQDEDLSGFGSQVHEAFRGYDQVGSEQSTTCNSPPCLQSIPVVDKTMVYVYGADHTGLLGFAENAAGAGFGLPQDLEYIRPGNQLCLSKAYTTAFFHWQLGGDSYFKGFIRDEWRPRVLSRIRTFKADGFGNPANRKIRIFSQISPEFRKVIHAFESGTGVPIHSPDVQVSHAPPFTFDGNPFYDRHATAGVFVGWPWDASIRFARWNVAPAAQVGSTYTHLSLRIGQVAGISENEPFHNVPGTDLRVYLGISDAFGETDLLEMEVPPPDPYLDGAPRARTAMSTFRFPVDELNPEMDLDHVDGIWLIIPNGSQGTVMVDSMEWHRDP